MYLNGVHITQTHMHANAQTHTNTQHTHSHTHAENRTCATYSHWIYYYTAIRSSAGTRDHSVGWCYHCYSRDYTLDIKCSDETEIPWKTNQQCQIDFIRKLDEIKKTFLFKHSNNNNKITNTMHDCVNLKFRTNNCICLHSSHKKPKLETRNA